MGWYGQQGRGTHAEIDAALMKGYDGGKDSHFAVTFTDCKLVGFNNHWSVYRENGEPKVICLALINRAPKALYGAGEWMYKPLDEDSGPNEVNCPLSLLDLVPPTGTEWGTRWRTDVIAYHAHNASLKGIKAGDSIKVKGDWREVTRMAKRMPVTYDETDGVLYRIPKSMIQEVRRG